MSTYTVMVTESDTAIALGSGDVPVLATPRLLAWFEAATVRAAAEHLAEGQTSVGVEVSMQHRRATPVGGRVLIAVASVSVNEGSAVFDVVGYELTNGQAHLAAAAGRQTVGAGPSVSGGPSTSGGQPASGGRSASGAQNDVTGDPEVGTRIIATARITRALVDRSAFLARLARG